MLRARPALLALPLLLAGCGVSGAQGDVTRTATTFQEAVQDKQLDRACALLSEKVLSSLTDGCEQELKAAEVPAASGTPTTDVYGQNGLVRWSGEAVFVSRFPEGWKVVAAGCEARKNEPYECSISGG